MCNMIFETVFNLNLLQQEICDVDVIPKGSTYVTAVPKFEAYFSFNFYDGLLTSTFNVQTDNCISLSLHCLKVI